MPGFAAIVGCARSNAVAVKIVRELQRRNILCFLSGNVNGRSIIHQLQEEGVELGYDTYTVPFGTDTISAIYALGFATRSALTFGGLKAGMAREILLYTKERVFASVLALGEVDDLKYAAAAGAINFGFPVIADTVIPEILPTGITTYEHVVSMPFDAIDGKDELEKAGMRVRIVSIVNPRRLYRPSDVAWDTVAEADGTFLSDDGFRALFHGDALIAVSGGASAMLEPVMVRSQAAKRSLHDGRFRLTTLRSHDQFNTTIYGHNDRYRGISGDRRVVLLHPDDLREQGLEPGTRVDLVSHVGCETRRVQGFRALPYDVPRRCAAAYFPEATALVPLAHHAEGSRTPGYKSIEISIEPSAC